MKKKNDVKKRKQPPSYPALIRGGILISALIMTASLSFYMGPSVLEKADRLYRSMSGRTSGPAPDSFISGAAGPIQEAGDRNKNRSRTRDSQEQTPRLSPTWKCHRNLDAWMT